MTGELNGIGLFLGGAIAVPLTSILSILVFIGFMFSLSPLLALLSLTIYPLDLIIIPYLQKRFNQLNRKRIKTTRAMANAVNEAISGIHEIHANGSYSLEENRLAPYIRQLYKHLKKLSIFKYGIKFTDNLFLSFGPFILFLVGGYLAIHGQFTLGALVAFLSAYEKIYDPWKELLEYYQSLNDARVSYRQIMKVFDHEPAHTLLPDSRPIHAFSGDIQLRGTSFTVDGGQKLLDDINLSIKANELVALVGFSGSGKSTLALLIAQLYDSTAGSIFFGEIDITTCSKGDISRNISMISQRPFIFTGTLRDNLLYSLMADGRAELPNRDTLITVIRDVGLEEDVLRFGFNTTIPISRVHPLRHKLLRMRQILNSDLKEHFARYIESYDVNAFLFHSSLRDNLIFGDSLSGKYALDQLPANKEFRGLLEWTGLDRRLTDFGHAIARSTVDILQDLAADEYFFSGSPMTPDELDQFTRLLATHGESLPSRKSERDLFLHLALRFIPAQHSITALPRDLEREILAARHLFLSDIIQMDIESCQHAATLLKEEGTILEIPRYEEPHDFIAFCPSEYLYSHCLRDNILFGAVKQDFRQDQELLTLALNAFRREDLLDEIIDIGLDFEVGSQGDRLSGGQKQKLAIARALLKDARILIMDEATASLDNASQAKIQAHLEQRIRGQKTVIAVIHRLDLTPSFDRIFVLRGGKVIEQGTYDQLMAQQGAFYELAQAK
jgi:putative ABC transport system ATP-binding protein